MAIRIIAHLDMDAFFAAVEERDHPRLKGKPIVVGADPKGGRGRGVVSTANYAARKYGIRSAMPISEAWRRAEAARKEGRPEAVFMAGSFKRYGEESLKIMSIIRSHALSLEQASVDEAYFDLGFAGSFAAARDIAAKIKQEIRIKERLTASIGIGPNKLIAKIASDAEKPDGLTVVSPERVMDFLSPLSIRALPGIGPKAEESLHKNKISTIKDLQVLTETQLIEMFGAWGKEMFQKARGQNDSPIAVEAAEAKSIGEQETFTSDTLDTNLLTDAARNLSRNVGNILKESGFQGWRTVVLTVRFANFKTVSRRSTLKEPITDISSLEFEVLKLLMPFLDKRENPKHMAIRLLGVRLEKLA